MQLGTARSRVSPPTASRQAMVEKIPLDFRVSEVEQQWKTAISYVFSKPFQRHCQVEKKGDRRAETTTTTTTAREFYEAPSWTVAFFSLSVSFYS